MLLLVSIWSTSNIYSFIGIRIRCQRIQTNSYSVTFGYSQYLVIHSRNDPEGRKTTICHYLVTFNKSQTLKTLQALSAFELAIFLIDSSSLKLKILAEQIIDYLPP